jgi:ABC-type multidrug transport system fused ATPase/permease subunit
LFTISEAVVQQALDKVAEKRTVLVVAHRLNTIRNSDMIIVMDKGLYLTTCF